MGDVSQLTPTPVPSRPGRRGCGWSRRASACWPAFSRHARGSPAGGDVGVSRWLGWVTYQQLTPALLVEPAGGTPTAGPCGCACCREGTGTLELLRAACATLFILSVLVFLSAAFPATSSTDHGRSLGGLWHLRRPTRGTQARPGPAIHALRALDQWHPPARYPRRVAARPDRSAYWDDCRSPPNSACWRSSAHRAPVIYSAVRQYTAADYVGRSVAIMGLATPNFWLGTMVMIYPAIWWAWSPPMEFHSLSEDPLGNLGMFLIPSLILGTYLSASTMRMTRTMMLEVLRQDYIRTAWAKGCWSLGILRHAQERIIPVDAWAWRCRSVGGSVMHREHLQPAGTRHAARPRLVGGAVLRHGGCGGQC